jgi:hypothetical protein
VLVAHVEPDHLFVDNVAVDSAFQGVHFRKRLPDRLAASTARCED